MFLLKQLKLQNILIGLLVLNTINIISASEIIKEQNINDNLCLRNQLTTNNDALHQDIQLNDKNINLKNNNADKNIKLNNKNRSNKCVNSAILKLKENCVEKFSIINDLQTNKEVKQVDIQQEDDSSSIDDNIFANWTYNEENKTNSLIKKKYQRLNSNLQKNTINFDIQPIVVTDNKQKIRKLSDASKSSAKSYFSNPVVISTNNKFKKIDEYLSGHKEIIPIITLQADGLQVLDTIAHLLAFNSYYKLINFGTNPYIYCASSGALPGLSLAFDLHNEQDPVNKLELIADKLYKNTKAKNTHSNVSDTITCCFGSWNALKLFWLKIFGCCIDYEDEDIIDSLYTKIPNNTLKNIIKEVLELTNKSNINIPNLIIKDVNSENGIVEQVLKANKNQDNKSIKNSITLFSKPFISVIKNFITNDKPAVEKGVDFVDNNIQGNALIKISSQDEIQFIQQKNLNDSTIDRLAIILSSNVDNNSQIQNDINNVKISYKKVEYEGSEDKLHTIKINIYTNNSITHPNYSFKNKYYNMKKVLSNSKELMYLIKHLPQMNSLNNSSIINDDLSNDSPIQEDFIIENIL